MTLDIETWSLPCPNGLLFKSATSFEFSLMGSLPNEII